MAWLRGPRLKVADRFVVGLAVGLAAMAVPMYIAEAAPSAVRGRLVTANSAALVGVQLTAAVVDGRRRC